MLRTAAAAALLCGSAAALSGCILGDDSDPPVLSVDFYWEDTDSRHSDNTCESADVKSMDWQLSDDQGNMIKEEESDCQDGFNFVDVGPGSYVLKVSGYDADHNKQWEGTCKLSLDRFDRAYPCDVGRIAQ